MKKDPTIPVYIVTGFLDGGKSNFLKFTLQEPYFNDGSKSLLILCEEGEEEFDEQLLKKTKTSLVTVEEESALTAEYLNTLTAKYKPDRVLIEFNGMWSVKNFVEGKFPKYWSIYQIITIFSGPDFGLYLNNIKMTAMELMTYTDMVIFNRCDDNTDMLTYQRTLRSVNTKCELVFEGEDGEELECPEPDLPYNLEADPIEITDEDFGTFYIDLSEHPERYENKRIKFLLQINRNDRFPANMFAGGRRAMTCCENDIRLLAYIFMFDKAKSLKDGDFANITATMKWEHSEAYNEEGPVFYVEDLKLAIKPAEELVYF